MKTSPRLSRKPDTEFHNANRTAASQGIAWKALGVALVLSASACRAGAQEPDNFTAPNTLTKKEKAEGWKLLFDGKTDRGWQRGSQADWKVEGGILSVRSGEPGLFYTEKKYGDFVLRLEFRAPKSTNSGVFLRTVPKPTDPTQNCYELNIAPAENPFPTGSLVARKKAEPVTAGKGWHTLEARLEKGKFTIRYDGKRVLEYEDPAPLKEGHIGLQLNQGPIEFRSIKLRPLPSVPVASP